MHNAVADDPTGQKRADGPVVPSQGRREIDRKGHDKPDIPGRKKEQTRSGQAVDSPALGKYLAEFGLVLDFPRSFFNVTMLNNQTTASAQAMAAIAP